MLLSLLDEGNYLGDVLVLEHGQHRAEYFLLESPGISRQVWNMCVHKHYAWMNTSMYGIYACMYVCMYVWTTTTYFIFSFTDILIPVRIVQGDELLFDVDLAAIEHFPSAGDRWLHWKTLVPPGGTNSSVGGTNSNTNEWEHQENIIILLCYVWWKCQPISQSNSLHTYLLYVCMHACIYVFMDMNMFLQRFLC